MRSAPRERIVPAAATSVTAALCATFTVAPAHASAIAVDIADVTLSTVPYAIDINGDLIPEYLFQLFAIPPIIFENDVDTGTNNVVGFQVTDGTVPVNGQSKLGTYAAALAAGDMISAATATGYIYVHGGGVILSGSSKVSADPVQFNDYGQFFDSGQAYVGLQFTIPDGTHYGWVEATGVNDTLTLTRYGYECLPDTGINAGAGTVGATCGAATVPEPGSLALLIAGAAGVLALRRRQRLDA